MNIVERIDYVCKAMGIPMYGYFKDRKLKINRSFFNNNKLGIQNIGKFAPSGEISVSELFPYAKSVICIALPHFTDEETYIPKKDELAISRYARCEDYHKVCTEVLRELLININCDGLKFDVFCDTGPFLDRQAAFLSGIGFYGKNTNIINAEYGSYISLAYAVTNLELEDSTPLQSECSDCRACLNACPGNAISENGFDYKKCFSYISQADDDVYYSYDKHEQIHSFGCDICQEVCKFNAAKEKRKNKFFNHISSSIHLRDIENMSNREFRKTYGNRAFSWRGKNIIIRNIKNKRVK